MVERSYLWQGSVTGDASIAPYNEDDLATYLYTMFQFSRENQYVIKGYLNQLVVSKVDDSNVSVASGGALVGGWFYRNTALLNIDLNAVNGNGYYRIVLRHDWAAKTVRAVAIHNAGALPALTQNPGVRWEVNLADAEKPAGTLTVTDRRRWVRGPTNITKVIRQALNQDAGYDYAYALDDTNHSPYQATHLMCMAAGTTNWSGAGSDSGNVSVTLPYDIVNKPAVIVTNKSTLGDIAVSTVPSSTGFTIYWVDLGGSNQTTLDFMWMAFFKVRRKNG